MGNDEKLTNKDKLSSTAIALIAAVTTAVIALRSSGTVKKRATPQLER